MTKTQDAIDAIEYALNGNGEIITNRRTLCGNYVIKKEHVDTIIAALVMLDGENK